MQFSKLIALGFSLAILSSCDSSGDPTLSHLVIKGKTTDGSEDWSTTDCTVDRMFTICQNPAQYTVKFSSIVPYACGGNFKDLCDESAGIEGANKALGGFKSTIPSKMTMIPYGTGYNSPVTLGGVPYTAGGVLLYYQYIETEVPDSGLKVRACYSHNCGVSDESKKGDLLYIEADSDTPKWMDSTDGTLSSTRPESPLTLQLVLNVEDDDIDSAYFFTPSALLTFVMGEEKILELTASIANSLHCNDSDEDNICDGAWPEYYFPALPQDWTATVKNF